MTIKFLFIFMNVFYKFKSHMTYIFIIKVVCGFEMLMYRADFFFSSYKNNMPLRLLMKLTACNYSLYKNALCILTFSTYHIGFDKCTSSYKRTISRLFNLYVPIKTVNVITVLCG